VVDFTPEIEGLRASIGDAKANALLARERREIFNVHPEIRIAAWAGALLIAAAVGLFVEEHFELFDKRLIAIALAGAAAACYWWAWKKREGTVSDYIVLLGALILSADVGFIEAQFDVFGEAGQRHFLVLAVLHGITAYVFDSRLVLSLSIAAFAAWMGLEQRNAFNFDAGLAVRALLCAAILLVWRFIDRRYRPGSEFSRVFEHFAANLALWGGLSFADDWPGFAWIVTVAVAAAVMVWGFRTRVESFVLYAFVYAVIATGIWLFSIAGDDLLVVLVMMLLAIPALVFIHRSFRRLAAA
jgi:Predicted membrane protein (DUF2157)